MIEIKNLTKKFVTKDAEFTAIEDINLSIKDGEIFGIVGRSGAGKTTLLRLLSNLEKPTSGSITINGEPAGKRAIGVVFQEYNLLMQQNVFDNVAIPYKINRVKKDVYAKAVEDLLFLVGIKEKAKEYPAKLSGGQRQRVAIARALACDSNILLLDEPTSALDNATTKAVLELLKNINKLKKTTIIIITHELEVVKSICNNAALIDSAHIVAKGSAKEILDILDKKGY